MTSTMPATIVAVTTTVAAVAAAATWTLAFAAPIPVPRLTATDAERLARPASAGTAMWQAIEPRLSEIHGCHERELPDNPGLAGDVVIHATVAPSGKLPRTTVFGVEAKLEHWKVMQQRVGPCVADLVALSRLPPFSDGMYRKIVVAFHFGPAPDAATPAPAALGPDKNLVHLASDVIDGKGIGFCRQRALLAFRRCWSMKDDQEGCSVELATAAGQSRRQLSIYKPGEAPDDRARSERRTRLWFPLVDAFGDLPWRELHPTDWPDDAAAMVLPDLGVALSAGSGRIEVAHRPAAGGPPSVTELPLRGGKKTHLAAVNWNASQPLLAITTRRAAAAALGDPEGAVTVSDVEIVDLAP